MTHEEVAALSDGADDMELHALGRQFGLLPLARDFDGVDASIGGQFFSDQFTRQNPFAHLAIVAGFIQPVQRDISNLRTFGIGADGKPNVVSPSIDFHTGEPLPILVTLFKGETVESLSKA